MLILIAPENARFEMGEIVATPGALDAFEDDGDFVNACLARHAAGDWGGDDLESADREADKAANDDALKSGEGRLFSGYKKGGQIVLWIITEGDQSHRVTTLLRPEDY